MDSIEKYLEESAQVAHEQKQLKSVFMIIAFAISMLLITVFLQDE